jgi:inosine/xanthosine triphosphatase
MENSPGLNAIMKIAVGSTNPTKTRAVENVLRVLFSEIELVALEVSSGIGAQPVGDQQTRRGAFNRARAALEATGAEWGFGLEGGIVQTEFGTMTNAWCVVVARDGRVGVGGSANMLLPERVADRVLQGVELGHAMDEYASIEDVKRKMGAIGVLTRGLLDRQGAYEYIVKLALARLVWQDWN